VVKEQKKEKKQTAVCCPIVYGSIAFFLGSRASDEYRTHEWTLFVRGARGEDLSYFIDKVVFKLHPSFAQPVREVTEAPFQVTEKGWGEFEAAIRLHFKDPTERPVELSHVVKLYSSGLTDTPDANESNPVVSQVYDEVVFTEPYEDFYKSLVNDQTITKRKKKETIDQNQDKIALPITTHPLQKYFYHFDDAQDLELLLRASEYVKQHLDSVKDAVYRLDHQIGVCKQMDQNRAAEAEKARQFQQQQQQQRQQQQTAPPQGGGSHKPKASSSHSTAPSHVKAPKGVAAAPASLQAAQPITAANLGTAQHVAAARNRGTSSASSSQQQH